MSEPQELLLEIGAEELPPKALKAMVVALGNELSARLNARGLEHGDVQLFATPRRLAVLIADVPDAQADREVERRGPSVSAAFDADGNPTAAAQGFARSCGVPVEHLEQIETDKGTQLAFRTTEVGEPTAALLPTMVEEAIARLPIPRRMRWADLDVEFARPVQWVVLLLGSEVVEAHILGVDSGRITRGHRFHHPEGMRLDSAGEYAMSLYSAGHVVADFEARMEMIRTQVEDAAIALGGEAVMDVDLLAETTALVEWPVAVTGSFDESFLRLPDAVLMAPMKGHQKFFPVRAKDGSLMPNFITISNIDSKNPQSVQSGNERVLRPRLADAAFFYDADLKRSLDDLQVGLSSLVFQKKLGSVADKAERVSKLAGVIAIAMGQGTDEVKLARRAGSLCKCDLLTQMVGEFPELQGVMGREYAINAGEPDAVSQALGEAYMPRFAGDAIPQSDTGRAVAIADKLDTLVGIFGIGNKPTGEKDPFALRRTALGVLRVIIESELKVDLRKLLISAVQGYDDRLSNEQTVDEVHTFMIERLRGYFTDKGIATEVYAAVQARNPTQPYDFARRVDAVHAFYQLPEAQGLAAANKRIQNILRQVEDAVPTTVKDELFKENAEWDLAAKLMGLKPRVQKLLSDGHYTEALTALAGLRESVDGFFDEVKVMDDDEAVKNNRLAILASLHELFIETADISRLQP
ncbi:MAG: glycyl-tRNA synthetase beta chain [Gammaproteobacteria bacterium]|jgi:glycyl-tRNA synthetase beta chain